MEYNIRVYKPELKQEEGKINNLKGFATITFDEAFCVKSLAIKESSKGNLYLDMPRYRDYETGEYVPFFRFTDKEFQKEVLDTVREAYENMTETKTDCKGCWGEEELYYNLSVNPVQGSDTFKADVAIRLQDVLAIQQLHVIQAWNGKTFVGMPQKILQKERGRILPMQSMQNLRQIWKVQSWTNTIKRWNMPKARNSSEEGDRSDS